MKENIAVFSAFKEESFKNVLGTLLVDEKGSLRSWNDFKKEAAKVNSAYNERYLKTEYHQTIAAANAAQKWNDIERTKHLYPNLRYLTVGDNRVRDKHRAWHGKVLPIDHPFWVKNFPPNDWGCRCDAERTDDEVTIEKELPKTFDNDKFKNNPGLTGKIFPETIYTNSLNQSEIERIKSYGINQFEKLNNQKSNYKAYQLFKKNEDYLDVQFDKATGGMKATHKLHHFDPNTGYDEKLLQNLFYKNGYSVILEDESAGSGKKVDGFINDIPMDFSSILGDGKNAIKRALKHSKDKNAKIAVIYFRNKDHYSYERLINGVKSFYGVDQYRFEKIYYVFDDTINEINL
ncbi:phage head morphogenesis protein [Empedobacter brevis]